MIGGAMLEFSRVVDQCGSPGERIAVLQKILAQAELLRHQGAVVATWRTQRGRTSGPFYRLAYRQGGRQRSIYLGRSALLARKVRALLAVLQRPMREERDWERLRRAVKSALRARKAEWARELAKHGFCLKGYEVRQWHDGQKGMVRPRSSRGTRAGIIAGSCRMRGGIAGATGGGI